MEFAQAKSTIDRLDRLDEQLEAFRQLWEHSIRLANEHTKGFNRLTAESSVFWDDGQPPLGIRDAWGFRLLPRSDRQLEPAVQVVLGVRQRG